MKAREQQAEGFLKEIKSLLATATHADFSDELSYDADILRGLAHVLAVGERPVDSTAN